MSMAAAAAAAAKRGQSPVHSVGSTTEGAEQEQLESPRGHHFRGPAFRRLQDFLARKQAEAQGISVPKRDRYRSSTPSSGINSHLLIANAKRKEHNIDEVGVVSANQDRNLLVLRPIERHYLKDASGARAGPDHRTAQFFHAQVKRCTSVIKLANNGKGEISSKTPAGDSLTSAASYFDRAYAYERLNLNSLAMVDYTSCLDRDPECAPAYFNRAGLAFALGNLASAVADLDHALLLDPGNLLFLQNRAFMLRKANKYMESTSDILLSQKIEARAREALLPPDSPLRSKHTLLVSPGLNATGSVAGRGQRTILGANTLVPQLQSPIKTSEDGDHHHQQQQQQTPIPPQQRQSTMVLNRAIAKSQASWARLQQEMDRKAAQEQRKKERRERRERREQEQAERHARKAAEEAERKERAARGDEEEDSESSSEEEMAEESTLDSTTDGREGDGKTNSNPAFSGRHAREKDMDPRNYFLCVAPEHRHRRALRKWAATIRKIPFFEFLDNFASEGVLLELASMITTQFYPKDSYIYKKGEVGRELFIVFSGLVAMTETKMLGQIPHEVVLKKKHKHEAFGEQALRVDGGARVHHAKAEMDTRVFVIDRPTFVMVNEKRDAFLRKRKIALIDKCPAFSTLSQEQKDAICDRGKIKPVTAHEVILEQQSEVKELSIIFRGVVKVLKHVPLRLCKEFAPTNPRASTADAAKDNDNTHMGANAVDNLRAFLEPEEEAPSADPRPRTALPGAASLTREPWRLPTPIAVGDTVWSTMDANLEETFHGDRHKEPQAAVPRKWLMQRNWTDAAAATSPRLEGSGDKHELLVGVLGSGELFGELAVLAPNTQSPVVVIAFTNVELLAIDHTVLAEIQALYNVHLVNFLNNSMLMHTPHPEKLAYLFGNRMRWEHEKAKVLQMVGPQRAEKMHKEKSLTERELIKNELVGSSKTSKSNFFTMDGHRLRKKAAAIPEHRVAEKMANYEAALAQYTKGRQQQHDSLVTIFYQGFVSFKMNKHDQALRFFEEALELNAQGVVAASPGTVQHLMAQVLTALEKFSEAVEAYRVAITLNPRNVNFKRDLVSLESHMRFLLPRTPSAEKRAEIMASLRDAQILSGSQNQRKTGLSPTKNNRRSSTVGGSRSAGNPGIARMSSMGSHAGSKDDGASVSAPNTERSKK